MEEALDETISRQLDTIQHRNSQAVYLAAFDIVVKLLGNIVNSPEDPRFRSVKKTNKMIQSKLLPCAGVLELFTLLGFTPLEDTLVFLGDNTVTLELTLAMIEGRVEELQQAQRAAAQRPHEETKAAPAKADYSKMSEEKTDQRKVPFYLVLKASVSYDRASIHCFISVISGIFTQ